MGLDAALELFVQSFDGVGCSDRFPLVARKAHEGEQAIAGFLQAVGDGAAFEPPFADEGLALCLDFLTRCGVDHVGVIGRDFLVQTLRGVGYEVAMLVHCAALNRRAGPKRRQRFIKARPAIDNNEFRRLQAARDEIIEQCVPTREIARRLGIAASTVRETLRRLESTGLNWPLPDDMTDGKLETALYTNRGTKQGHRRHAEPDWPMVHRELKRKHVTLLIVWDEYIAENPGGYSYSRFCELYRAFESRLPVTMRQTHAAGERLFVDYAGDSVPVVVDRLTGEIRKAQIFVAVLGASSFSYARATWTQTLVDWIDAHVQAFGAIGGAPHLLVPDNTKAAVVKACLYDPLVNRTYADMAAHYGTAILPARPRRPRDKAKVEQAVLIVERWLLGRLRHRTFYSLAEVNAAIGELLKLLNEERPIRRLGVTRRQLLEEVDRPALKPLPCWVGT